ncbi:DoxX family protein [Pontibacter sp. SGAir0037]|uniref:DoxX family protein n=1 Tax=Pontibacter sp. SGAir0037 TaxID=2571030 RepID=UPI0010CCD391|nr:DoxX family protein [Pontibacter sp. SGAir0037]QCR21533.1 DoxX family protein [Pontibacter sp. SGAir0037]
MKNAYLSYLLGRLPIAVSMFGHGLVRLPKLDKFSAWMVGSFESTFLPTPFVTFFSYALPIIELNIGFLLLVGLFTRQAIVAGILVMLVLIFGSSLLEEWQNVFIQMMYGAYFAVLLAFAKKYNRYSVDRLFFRKSIL